ncbi:MAG: enoyl-CoA hydratase/isomerase family protein, partial [Longimicrobiales bacterium]
SDPVKLLVEAPLAIAQLHRPERMNAVSLPLYQALENVLRSIADDRSVRAAVLTGSGRAFCVGADLQAHGSGELSAEQRQAYVAAAQLFNRRIQTLPKPIVAAVNGHAIGAGLELALSCDFIVVAADAKLRLPELSLGTFVGGGVMYTLAQRVGVAKARELIMLGEFILAGDAVAMGLANRSVPAEETLDTSKQIAVALAAKAPISMALAKELLDKAQHLDPDRVLELETEALLKCMGTHDWREGVQAFKEKREPAFSGD